MQVRYVLLSVGKGFLREHTGCPSTLHMSFGARRGEVLRVTQKICRSDEMELPSLHKFKFSLIKKDDSTGQWVAHKTICCPHLLPSHSSGGLISKRPWHGENKLSVLTQFSWFWTLYKYDSFIQEDNWLTAICKILFPPPYTAEQHKENENRVARR